MSEVKPITPEMDAEWERLMRQAFPIPESGSNGRRLYMIVRRATLMVLAAFDAHYGVAEVDRSKRRR
jgi:hypothetical protein